MASAVSAGTALGALIFRTNIPGRRMWAALLLVLACLPVYVSGTALLAATGITPLLESRLAAGLLYGLILTPLAAAIIGSGLQGAPRACEDAALLDAGPARVLWNVSLPASRWHVAGAGLIVVLVTATDTFLTDVLQVRTFAEETYTQFTLQRLPAGPLLLSLPLVGVLSAGLILAWQRRPAPPPAGSRAPGDLLLGRPRALLALVLLALGAAALWIVLGPLLSALQGWQGFTSAARTMLPELQTSCLAGLAAATLCAVLAPGLSWLILQGPGLRWLVVGLLVFLLSTPGPVLGIALIELLNRDGLPGLIYDSPGVLVIGLVARFLPVAVLLMTPALEAIPREVVDAAHLDGAGPAAQQRHVVWPLCWQRICGVWFLALALALGETACSVLIAPPGHTPLAVRFFTLIHYGIYREAAAVVILTVLIVLVPALILARAILPSHDAKN
jgi:iron(III) transport system permease protein